MQAVILAAGKGTRLAPLTEHTPKGLVDISAEGGSASGGGGTPLLQVILEALPKEVSEIIFVVGHLKEQIEKRFGASWNGRAIHYVVQDPLDGTATAVRLAAPYVRGSFLVVNGDDVYAAADLERLIAHPVALLIQPTMDAVAHSALVDDHGHFLGLESDPPMGELHRRVCGAYMLDERFFRYQPMSVTVRSHKEYSLPHTLIELAKDAAVRVEEATYWRPVGTHEELKQIRRERTGERT